MHIPFVHMVKFKFLVHLPVDHPVLTIIIIIIINNDDGGVIILAVNAAAYVGFIDDFNRYYICCVGHRASVKSIDIIK